MGSLQQGKTRGKYSCLGWPAATYPIDGYEHFRGGSQLSCADRRYIAAHGGGYAVHHSRGTTCGGPRGLAGPRERYHDSGHRGQALGVPGGGGVVDKLGGREDL